MRVAVVGDRVLGHSPPAVAHAVARGWLTGAPDSSLAVVPLAAGGPAWVEAWASLHEVEPVLLVSGEEAVLAAGVEEVAVSAAAEPVDPGAAEAEPVAPGSSPAEPGAPASRPVEPPPWDRPGSHQLGRAVAAVLAAGPTPRRLLLDLTLTRSHDGGEGMLDVLGGVVAARERLAGTELVGVVGAGEARRRLLGLRGVTALRGATAAPGSGIDAGTETQAPQRQLARDARQRLLALDARLQRHAESLGPGLAERAGAGAAGGAGLAVLALGGRLVEAVPDLAEETGLATTLRAADVVVVATSGFDFASRGGTVVQTVAQLAATALRPCLVLAGWVQIGARERRLLGVESAHALTEVPLPGQLVDVGLTELAAGATRLARGWVGAGRGA